MVLILKKLQKNMIHELTKWKERNQHNFQDDNKLSLTFNKAVIKLMDITFNQDNNMSRIKNGLYDYLKRDLKSVEFEFEF
jgi:ABC-type uncharacterized transport system substrate-binding protein